MDFTTLELGENLAEDVQQSKQATYDEIVARHTVAMSKELKYNGGKLIAKPLAARVAKNPVTQTEYDCRLYALLNIVRNPELSIVKNPLASSWKALYPNIPYNDKATNWGFRDQHKDKIVDLMKELGVWRRFRWEGSKSVITIMKDIYKSSVIEDQARVIAEQDERIQHYQFLMDNTDDRIIYKGHVMPFSSKHRGYHITLGGKQHIITKANIAKMQLVFDFIDMFDE